jgi:hypothetical protein
MSRLSYTLCSQKRAVQRKTQVAFMTIKREKAQDWEEKFRDGRRGTWTKSHFLICSQQL